MRDERLLTIGDFARASRLSAKALRRYDELGLLPPARVDPFTGYRYYTADQLERARLLAWLRRIGMPLAEAGQVCDRYETDAPAAAREIRAYWARVESETAARRDLAASLVNRLRGDPAMTSPTSPTSPASPTSPTSPAPVGPTATGTTAEDASTGPYVLDAAALADPGLCRESQQDTAHAGPRLLAVADGYGPEGDRASAAAVAALGFDPPRRAGDALNALDDAVRGSADALAGLDGSGTTLTAAVWTGEALALAHVGDSRAYLLRDGELVRLTRDHTVVQSMIDAGELDPSEAATRPDRVLLLKALDGGPVAPDLQLRDVRPGDRWLLCTDGLSALLPPEELRLALAEGGTPTETARSLVTLARGLGAPDNIACVVADVRRTPPRAAA